MQPAAANRAHDAFGEVTAKTVGGQPGEHFDYYNAGRL